MKNGFWTNSSRYGLIHQAGQQNPQHPTECLVVFVHGLFGDCRATWGQMPEWVVDNIGVDVDVVSFSYPSKVWHRSSVSQAADDLATWMETEFQDIRHLLFITHSTGGLIVKQMLRRSFSQIKSLSDNAELDYSSSSSAWLRTRRVINIAVPHRGGLPLVSIGGRYVYALAYVIMAPFLRLIRFLTQGHKDWGRNRIIATVRWKNPWLLKLENDFVSHQEESEEMDLPYPISQDLQAKSDLAVPFSADPQQRTLYFRGTHESIKVPKRSNSLIVSIVAEVVRLYASDIVCTVVDRSLQRIAAVNKVTDVGALIKASVSENPDDQDRPQPRIAVSSFGTQAEIVSMVVESVRRGRERPRRIVVTGSAGVGKSLVTRMIAWRLGREFLAAPDKKHPLPLYIPLQQISLERTHADSFSWETMWDWWINWATSMYPDSQFSQEWLELKFRNQATTVILDGLDDFLQNHSTIGLTSILNMLRDVTRQYSDNNRLSIVVGIRNTFHGLQRLASDPKDIYEILRLSIGQAKQIYPKCQSWIDTVPDRNLLDLILTPLILANYEPDSYANVDQITINPNVILGQTMRTILSRSHLVGGRIGDRGVTEINHLEFGLELVAWLFFYKSRGEVNIDVLRDEAKKIRQRWENFFDDMKTNEEMFFNEGLRDGIADILLGFRLVEQLDTCKALLQSTVFVPTGPNMVRFAHRHWQELLLGKYFALCIRTHHFDELGIAAFNSRIYRAAGESFVNSVISEDCIRSLLKAWTKSHNTYITGNVIAFLTWTRTGIDARAIQLLLDQLSNFEPLSRLVLIGGLGYRVLVDNADDYALGDLRRALFPKLCLFSDPANSPVDDLVASSMSWCYQKAFAELFGLPRSEIPWPAIGFDDDTTVKAVPMVCAVENGEFVLDERSRSFQAALLVPVLEAYNDSKLAIRALHYLYYLLVARKYGVHVVELSQELPSLLRPGCQYEQIMASCESVPEVLELYKKCQAFHNEIDLVAL